MTAKLEFVAGTAHVLPDLKQVIAVRVMMFLCLNLDMGMHDLKLNWRELGVSDEGRKGMIDEF